MKNFVNPEWLFENLDNKDIVLVDCRADLFDRDYGRRAYEESHIKGAFFLDVKKDLSGEVQEHGGRSPLPDMNTFKEKLEAIGITNDKTIVAYDEAKLAGAGRLWWMLKYIGIERAYILNGGINAWSDKGYPMDNEVPKAEKGIVNINLNENIKTDIFDIKSKLNNKDFVIVDSRAPERYRGEIEPIDKKAGHIPGAKNYHSKNVFDEKGKLKAMEELKIIYDGLERYNEIVLQCGSGIDACGNFVAMDEIGLTPKLYVGSWSDWVSYEDSPIIVEKQN